MASDPLVSIVLPVYNGSRFLAESLDSCLAQSWQNWELIIVDDASTDATQAIIASCAAQDPRIKPIRNPRNLRLPASLNKGFQAARGELFTWTSDDNRFYPDALSEMVRFLRDQPPVDLVYADFEQIDENGVRTGIKKVQTPDHLWEGNCVGACFLYKRQVHEKLEGYAENLFLAEDYDFWLRASAHFQMKPLHKTLYAYRYHDASLTTAQAHRTAALSDQALARNLPALTWMSPELRVEAALRLIKGAVLRRQPREIARWTGFALKTSPTLAARAMVMKCVRGLA